MDYCVGWTDLLEKMPSEQMKSDNCDIDSVTQHEAIAQCDRRCIMGRCEDSSLRKYPPRMGIKWFTPTPHSPTSCLRDDFDNNDADDGIICFSACHHKYYDLNDFGIFSVSTLLWPTLCPVHKWPPMAQDSISGILTKDSSARHIPCHFLSSDVNNVVDERMATVADVRWPCWPPHGHLEVRRALWWEVGTNIGQQLFLQFSV